MVHVSARQNSWHYCRVKTSCLGADLAYRDVLTMPIAPKADLHKEYLHHGIIIVREQEDSSFSHWRHDARWASRGTLMSWSTSVICGLGIWRLPDAEDDIVRTKNCRLLLEQRNSFLQAMCFWEDRKNSQRVRC